MIEKRRIEKQLNNSWANSSAIENCLASHTLTRMGGHTSFPGEERMTHSHTLLTYTPEASLLPRYSEYTFNFFPYICICIFAFVKILAYIAD